MIKNWVHLLLWGLVPLIVACQPAPEETQPIQQSPDAQVDDPSAPDDQLFGDNLRQWAISAEAGSSYADPEWGAEQATGAPDTFRCGDYQTAWASAGPDAIDWIELTYDTDVHATGVNIVQTFNANQVTKVELINALGRAITVYEGQPTQIDQPCPYTLSIIIDRTDRVYNTVRITVDQSSMGLGWNEIDAVELIGEPAN